LILMSCIHVSRCHGSCHGRRIGSRGGEAPQTKTGTRSVSDCHDRISNNDGKTTFSPTIANYRRESHITGRPKTATRAFVRPHCVPNPKIAEIHLLRHCRDRDVMFGRRDMEHKATEVYRYYRSLRDSLSDSRLKSLKSFRSIPPCLSLCIDSATRPVPTSATFSYVPDSTFDAEPSLPINRHLRPRSLVVGVGRRALSLVGVAP